MSEHAPNSVEAEMSALGAMFLSDRAMEELVAKLKPDDFYRPAHRVIFSAFQRLATAGKPSDFELLKQDLKDRGLYESVGQDDYLLELAQYVPSPANAHFYADTVLDKSARRAYIQGAKALLAKAIQPDSTLDEIAAVAREATEARQVEPGVFRHFGEIDISEPDLGVSTGYPSLDRFISTRGYPEGQMSVVRAYHKGGKSMFMIGSAIENMIAGKRVLYATFADLSDKQIKRRIVRYLSGFGRRPEGDIFAEEDFDKALVQIANKFAGYCYDASTLDTGATVETFAAWLKAEHRRQPFDIVYVDYAQELSSASVKATNMVAEQAECARVLARLAAKLKLPVVVGSQITEGQNGAKAITKHSRSWEEKAGWVVTLQREGDTEATVEVSYSRFGPQNKKLTFGWNSTNLRFEDPRRAA